MDRAKRQLALITVAGSVIEMSDAPIASLILDKFQDNEACIAAGRASLEQRHDLFIEQFLGDPDGSATRNEMTWLDSFATDIVAFWLLTSINRDVYVIVNHAPISPFTLHRTKQHPRSQTHNSGETIQALTNSLPLDPQRLAIMDHSSFFPREGKALVFVIRLFRRLMISDDRMRSDLKYQRAPVGQSRTERSEPPAQASLRATTFQSVGDETGGR